MIDKNRIENAVTELLLAVGEDPGRAGLRETPQRIASMYEELFGGMYSDPKEILKYFDEDFSDEMVVLNGIPFHSMCEHHLLPFYGSVSICYIPAPGKLLGLSKLARLVDLYARRLQLQEKMCGEIADFLENDSGAKGVAVVIEAEHLCMTMRGIKKNGTKTTTTSLRGLMKTDCHLRAEALNLICNG